MTRKIEQMRWPGGEHDFLLRYGEIEILQDKCDAGPEFILNALAGRTYLQNYAFEVLRLGLVGGGMGDDKARAMVNRVKEDLPLREFVIPALNVLGAALTGYVDDQPGGDSAEGENPASRETDGNLAASTEAVPS